MTDGVKAGQVWQHKNSGRRVELKREADDDYNWVVTEAGSTEERQIPEWLLTDDYVLAIGVP